MKKKVIIFLVIIILIILSIIISNVVKTEGKKYEIEQIEQHNYLKLKSNDKYGVIDRQGNIIVETKYENIKIPNPEVPVFICYDGNYIVSFDATGTEIHVEYGDVTPIELENIASEFMYEKTVLRYKEGDKYGLIDYEGNKITNAIYEEINGMPYKEGELLVKKDGKYGVINIKGNEIVDIKYEQIAIDGYYTETDKYTNSGYIVQVRTDEGYRYGYLDNLGNTIIEPEYNDLKRIIEKENENIYLLAAKNGQYGIFRNEDEIIKFEYQSIVYDISNDIFIVEKSKRYGAINSNGLEIIPIDYLNINVVGKNIIATNNSGSITYNANGEQLDLEEGIIITKTDNPEYDIKSIMNDQGIKYGVIDNEGNEVIPAQYYYIKYLNKGNFIINSETSKLGVINELNELKIPTEYETIGEIQNTNLIQAISINDKEEKITIYTEELEVVYEIVDGVLNVEDEYIKLYNSTETIYLDFEGNIISNKDIYNNELYAVKKDNKWGFEDINGNIIIETKYDKVTEFNEYGYASIKIENKWGAIDKTGKIVAEIDDVFQSNVEPEYISKYFQLTYGYGEIYFTADQ